MASGWARDGAIQDQIDASVNDAVQYARQNLISGASAEYFVLALLIELFKG